MSFTYTPRLQALAQFEWKSSRFVKKCLYSSIRGPAKAVLPLTQSAQLEELLSRVKNQCRAFIREIERLPNASSTHEIWRDKGRAYRFDMETRFRGDFDNGYVSLARLSTDSVCPWVGEEDVVDQRSHPYLSYHKFV